MTLDTSGFYKASNDVLLYAPTIVTGPDVALVADDHASYTYPVDGWSWYGTEDAARTATGIPVPEPRTPSTPPPPPVRPQPRG